MREYIIIYQAKINIETLCTFLRCLKVNKTQYDDQDTLHHP